MNVKYQFKSCFKVKSYQYQCCYSFALNKSNSVMIVGQEKGKIKIYQFGRNNKLLHTLKQHYGIVLCLIFMLKSNQFISACYQELFIWHQDVNNFWKPQQTLINDNLNSCVVLNKNEDLIISGGGELKTIKFWEKTNQCWSLQQEIQTYCIIDRFNFNFSEEKLIACGRSKSIIVMEKDPEQKWIISQTIEVEKGNKLCFIDENEFIFQPYWREYLNIYNFDLEMKQFIQKKIVLNSFSDSINLTLCHYVQSKNILIITYDERINIFRRIQNGDLWLEQRIECQTNDVLGFLADHGNFLITWDVFSQHIQIRKYIEFIQ